jgi:ribosomal protein S18 acetylase RimI-like enzyme
MSFDPQIILEDDDEDVRGVLTRELLASLGEINRQSTNCGFSFCCKDRGMLVAGISCSLSYDWVHVELLWVREDQRRQGLAKRLLENAERYALKLGAKRAWLESTNKQAVAFYERYGYIPFGKLSNDATQFPPEIERVFMEKRLDG